MLIEHRNRLKQSVQSDTAKPRVVGRDKGQKASRCPAQNPNEGTSSVSARWGKGRIKEPGPCGPEGGAPEDRACLCLPRSFASERIGPSEPPAAPGKAVPPRERNRAVDYGCDRQFEQ